MTALEKQNETPAPNINLKDMANAVRALAMDAVEKAQSGHPGMPMGMADVATVLYSKFLKFNPEAPLWPDRDRFVLSAGHGSMLLYAINYLTGYKHISLEDLRNFRQLNSVTAGHPEVEQDAGIETTTGPLGQGIATAVGMAMAETLLSEQFGQELVDHHTYVIASDGDMMEGISHEACSLAGHKKLDKLIVLYDDNGISIDGPTNLSFNDDTSKRFEAYGWDVQTIDGHDYDAIETAIAQAQTTKTPSLICCKTQIGFGSPNKANSASSHGAPLGEDEIVLTREALGWSHAPFEIPDTILQSWRGVGRNAQNAYESWQERHYNHAQKDQFDSTLTGDVTKAIAPVIQKLKQDFADNKPGDATRKLSGQCLEELNPALPQLIGGSADLTGSNNTKTKATAHDKQYIYYGVREHAMAAAMNGMALHGGIIPYGGTFLIFSDYCRPSIRLSALMQQRVIYVMTHDSIGLGEDGPTHQPVEHLASLRAIPNLRVFRPCDGVETAESWQTALESSSNPSVLTLTRQGLPTLCEARQDNLVAKGAYILQENSAQPAVTLYASGSEVSIVHEAYIKLEQDGVNVRLVSVPCMDLFLEGDADYINGLCGDNSIKIAVEAAVRQGWDEIIGRDGIFIGMNSFGASAPHKDLYDHFGITSEAVYKAAKNKL